MYAFYGYFRTHNRKDMTEKQELEQLLNNIQKGLKIYSVKELNEAVIEALNKKQDKGEEIDFILSIVSKHFGVSVRTLKMSKARGTVNDAKHMTYCLLHFNLGLSIRHISQRIFFNYPTSVVRGINRIKFANPSIKQDKEFLTLYEGLQAKLLQHITDKQAV